MRRLFESARPTGDDRPWRDALAGVALAAMNVPQVLGYTRIAGTPVVTGLYTLLLPIVAFAAFGSSRYLVVAADSATAAILAGTLPTMAPAGSAVSAWRVPTDEELMIARHTHECVTRRPPTPPRPGP